MLIVELELFQELTFRKKNIKAWNLKTFALYQFIYCGSRSEDAKNISYSQKLNGNILLQIKGNVD